MTIATRGTRILVAAALLLGTPAAPAQGQPAPALPPPPPPTYPAPPTPYPPATAAPYGQPPAGYGQPPAGYGQPPAGYQPPSAYRPPAGYGTTRPPAGFGTSRPAGDVVETEPVWPMVIGGSAGFGLVYLSGIVAGAAFSFDNESGYLAVPFVGPWITAAKRTGEDDNCDSGLFGLSCSGESTTEVLMGLLLAADGIVQIGAVTTAILGLVLEQEADPPVAIAPLGGEATGIAVHGRF